MSKGLPKKEDNFSAWYNELVKKADLAENSSVRGCMVIKPYGFSIWEKMQSKLDEMFKETGHVNDSVSLFEDLSCLSLLRLQFSIARMSISIVFLFKYRSR